MSRFNLSEWALSNRSLVTYFMVLFAVIGAISFFQLGQSEDPPFTFRVMVIRTYWPGATPDEVDRLVTDRIEEKLQELEMLDYTKSYSRPGESVITTIIREDKSPKLMAETYYQIRKKVGDIRYTLPQGVAGPFFNDEFGDTFGNIYALTGKGIRYEELKEYADRIRERLLHVKEVAKVEFLGVQDERIYIELANSKRSQLGISPNQIFEALQAQNAVSGSGDFNTHDDKINVRVSGGFTSVDDVRNMPLSIGSRTLRLGDIAEVFKGYEDPASPRVRFNGEPTIAIAVSMDRGGDIIRLGHNLDTEVAAIMADLPLGLDLGRVNDQPRAVTKSVHDFTRALAEAIVIVLAVTFLSLGLRTGLVVALSIPLVLAMTFAAMRFFGIDLHKISLGALILALGLLVDDAIIAVEMMAVKIEQGFSRVRAAAFAYKSTAFPMLSGTLITAAGFLPIATAASSTGEYTRSIFQVITIALLLSWIAAVMFVPLIGFKLLPERKQGGEHDQGELRDVYDTRFYRAFRRLVAWCVNHRWLTIGSTLALFAFAVGLFGAVPNQFFPDSTRLELLVDLKLPEGASVEASNRVAKRLEGYLAKQEGIENYTTYVGSGAPRFYLALDQQLPQASLAQFVINTQSLAAREKLRANLLKMLPLEFSDVRWRVNRLENGPPVGYVLQYRVSGPDRKVAHGIADKIAAIMRASPYPAGVHLDTFEPSKVIKVDIDQDRARALGVSSQDIRQVIDASTTGVQVSALRKDNKLIPIEVRGATREREYLQLLNALAIPTPSGKPVPLDQLAEISDGFEDGILWRRDRVPTITVRADVYADIQPPQVVAQLAPQINAIALPRGYHIVTGGTVEDSGKGSASVNAGMPLLIFVVFTILMIQLGSFSRTLIVVLTAPLGIIGVPVFLLLFGKPFGFVAMLGTIALSGMIMRNSLILIDQIEQDLRAGHSPFEAVVDATVRRLRPIVLTAAAAVLAMIPLARSAFFGPTAVVIMGGLIAATALTLLFLPALYAAWFRIREGQPAHSQAVDAPV